MHGIFSRSHSGTWLCSRPQSGPSGCISFPARKRMKGPWRGKALMWSTSSAPVTGGSCASSRPFPAELMPLRQGKSTSANRRGKNQ